MKEITFDRKNLKSYKDFYSQLYKELDGKNTIDWEDYADLHFNANLLDEFLWYKSDESIKYIFKNFDLEKIKNYKNFDDYEYNIILKIYRRFINNYPNNQLIFVNDEK